MWPPNWLSQPADGIAGINAVLRSRGAFDTFATLFDDWVVANFLDSRPPSGCTLCVRHRSIWPPSLCRFPVHSP